VHGLRQYDNRPRSPVIVPHNLSELRKKILFENTLLEERALHEFSAGKGDGAGVDTGSAPLAPASAAAPSGIPVASTASVNIAEVPFIYVSPFTKKLAGYGFGCNNNTYFLVVNSGLIYMNSSEDGNSAGVLISPGTTLYKDDYLWYTSSIWKMTGFGDDEGSPNISDSATNPSTDPTIIPTSGWTGYYGNLTITAA